jgi:hypothetical protein
LAMIFIAPFVVLFCLCNFGALICVSKSRSESKDEEQVKKSKELTPKSRRTILWIVLIALIGITLLAIVVIVFSSLFSAGVSTVTSSTNDSIDRLFNAVDTVGSCSNQVRNLINYTFTEANMIVHEIPTLNDPLNLVQNGVRLSSFLIKNLTLDVIALQNQIDIVNEMVANVQNSLHSNMNLTLPNIGSQVSLLNTALTEVNSMDTQITHVEQILNSSLFQDSLNSAQNTVQDLTNGPLDIIDSAVAEFDKERSQYFSNSTQDMVFTYTGTAEVVRMALSISAVLWAILLYTLTLATLYRFKSKSKQCLFVTSCFTFLTAWIMFLIGAISIILWIGMTDICTNLEPSAYSLLNSTGITWNNNANNLAEASIKIMYCDGNQDVLTITGFPVSTLNISMYRDQLYSKFGDQINRLSVDPYLQLILNSINEYNSQAGMYVNADYENMIQNLRDQLQAIETSKWNTSSVQGALQALNIYLKNITKGQYQFSAQNITTVDQTNLKNVITSQQYQIVKQQQQNIMSMMKPSKRDQISDAANFYAQLQANITAIDNALGQMQIILADARSIQRALSQGAVQWYYDLVDLGQMIDGLKNNMTTLVDGVFASLNKTIDAIENIAKCDWIGSYYQDMKRTICQRMTIYIGTTGIAIIIIGVLMFTVFPLILVAMRGKQDLQVVTIKTTMEKPQVGEHPTIVISEIATDQSPQEAVAVANA